MRRVLLDTCKMDRQAEQAASRITRALSADLTSNSANALDDVTTLRFQVRDLQRKCLELQFLVDHPNFNLDAQLANDRLIIGRNFANGETITNLYARYGYDYFSDNYHPEYISKVCGLLYNACLDHRVSPNQLWNDLLITAGFITKDIILDFGPVETDKGII